MEWKPPANVNFEWTDDGFKLEVEGKINTSGGNKKDVMVICTSIEETQTITTRDIKIK